MNSQINNQNITHDSVTYGKWALLNKKYFSHPKIISELFNLFAASKVSLPILPKIIDLGSAEGLVGEFFWKKLGGSLTLLDIVKEHLEQNLNPHTQKICKNILEFNEKNTYDLIIMSSVLHYFSKTNQMRVLKNIRNALKQKGYFLLKVFVQQPEFLGTFLKLSKIMDRNPQLLSQKRLENNFKKAGFSFQFLDNAIPWNVSLTELKNRYSVSQDKILKMKQIIKNSSSQERSYFTNKKESLILPVPYKVYLLRKEN